MRRFYASIFAIGFFLGMLTGCQNFFCHTAGVCDCDNDDDPCTHRAPWVRNGCGPKGCGSRVGAAPTVDGTSTNTEPVKGVQGQPVSRKN